MQHLTRLWRRLSEQPATREDAARAEHQRRLNYHQVFGSDAGRRVLADILRRCHLMQSTYVAGDTHATAFNEGARRVGLQLVETINQEPDAVARMLRSGQVEELFDERDAG